MSKRKYSIHKAPGQHLTEEMRILLRKGWNAYLNKGVNISMRKFALMHGLNAETWRRELKRGALGPISWNGNKWIYPEYDDHAAQASINEGKSNMGTRMKVTSIMATMFKNLVLNEKRSPFDARCLIQEAFPDKAIPCLRTFYNHIETGDMGVMHGQTPYHPGRKRKRRIPPHEAHTQPGRRQLKDRPPEADLRQVIGHLEMDTVVSGIGGHGGLLVLQDRCTRLYFTEYVSAISQDATAKALRRILKRADFPAIKSVTTDNGCEFLDQKRLDRIFKCKVFYTRAYASYEKGSIENCNRLVRRWYPKGTDFSQLSQKNIRQLEQRINSIHRESLGGYTAHEYHSNLASVS